MNSEFSQVPLDRIRYSLVWEDSDTLYESLQPNADDHVLVITSAGCNVLNILLKNPLTVTAIDLNPEQNKLLLFKKYLIQNFDYQIFRALMGFEGPAQVELAWREIKPILPEKPAEVWDTFFRQNPGGLVVAGQLEKYLSSFYHTLSSDTQGKLKHLLSFSSVPEQLEYFRQELDQENFKQGFIQYFDAANLSKGRDPKLFKYAVSSCGEIFYNRLVQQLASALVRNNFFFRFFFFGPENIPMGILPPCYQEQNFRPLRRKLEKLTIVTGEAINYLGSPAGRHINKASLSNIFEYTSQKEFRKVCQGLFLNASRELKLVFWNLLQAQGRQSSKNNWQTKKYISINSEKSCFYFADSRVLENLPVPAIY